VTLKIKEKEKSRISKKFR